MTGGLDPASSSGHCTAEAIKPRSDLSFGRCLWVASAGAGLGRFHLVAYVRLITISGGASGVQTHRRGTTFPMLCYIPPGRQRLKSSMASSSEPE